MDGRTVHVRAVVMVLLGVALALSASCGRDTDDDARRVRVAAAADLQFAFAELVEAFRAEHPEIAVEVAYGSSGNFLAQLRQRAPFDVYFSADIDYPRRLIETGDADGSTLFTYAIGRVVVWAPNDSPLDPKELGMATLAAPSVRRIAIANPQHAPYGVAAKEAIRRAELLDSVEPKLVLGENVAQAAHFVRSGAAEVGVIALSLALAPAMSEAGRHWLVPEELHEPLEQGAVILRWATDREAAEAFARFVQEPAGRAIMERYGFVGPGPDRRPAEPLG